MRNVSGPPKRSTTSCFHCNQLLEPNAAPFVDVVDQANVCRFCRKNMKSVCELCKVGDPQHPILTSLAKARR